MRCPHLILQRWDLTVFPPFHTGCGWEYLWLQTEIAEEVRAANNKASKPFKQFCGSYLKAVLQCLFSEGWALSEGGRCLTPTGGWGAGDCRDSGRTEARTIKQKGEKEFKNCESSITEKQIGWFAGLCANPEASYVALRPNTCRS